MSYCGITRGSPAYRARGLRTNTMLPPVTSHEYHSLSSCIASWLYNESHNIWEKQSHKIIDNSACDAFIVCSETIRTEPLSECSMHQAIPSITLATALTCNNLTPDLRWAGHGWGVSSDGHRPVPAPGTTGQADQRFTCYPHQQNCNPGLELGAGDKISHSSSLLPEG